MLLLRTSVAFLALAGGLATGCATVDGDPPAVFPEPSARAAAAFMRGSLMHHRGQLEPAAEAYAEAARLDPDSAELQLYLATVWGEMGDRGRALEHVGRAGELAPDDPRVRELSAEIFLGAGRSERGIDLLRSLLDSGEISESGSLRLFRAYFERGDLTGVERVLLRMIEEAPDDPRPRLLLGSSYEQFGQTDRAEAVYREALEREPAEPEFYDRLSQLLARAGDADAEFEVLERKLALEPDDPYALERISDLYEQRDRTEQSVDLLEKLVGERSTPPLHPSLLRAYVRLGRHYYAQERFADAAALFESAARGARASENMNGMYLALFLLGAVYSDSERAPQALRALERIPPEALQFAEAQRIMAWIFETQGEFERALDAARRALDSGQDARRHGVFLASLLQRGGDLDSAVSVMNGLISRFPEEEDLLYDLGVLYGEAGDRERALDLMQQVLARNRDHSGALNYVGYTWAERGERLDEAESLIRRAIELEPDDGNITDSLGWVLYQRGLQQTANGHGEAALASFLQAVEQLERAHSQLESPDPVIVWHLGDAYHSVARFEDALRSYEEALQLGPDEEDAEKIRVQIEELRLHLSGGTPGVAP